MLNVIDVQRYDEAYAVHEKAVNEITKQTTAFMFANCLFVIYVSFFFVNRYCFNPSGINSISRPLL